MAGEELIHDEWGEYYEDQAMTCDEYSHFLGFSNDSERDQWLNANDYECEQWVNEI